MVTINLIYFFTCGNLQFFDNSEGTGQEDDFDKQAVELKEEDKDDEEYTKVTDK